MTSAGSTPSVKPLLEALVGPARALTRSERVGFVRPPERGLGTQRAVERVLAEEPHPDGHQRDRYEVHERQEHGGPDDADALEEEGDARKTLKSIYDEEAHFYQVIRDILVAHLHGNAAQVSVEIGRGSVPSEHQPSFAKLEEALNNIPAEGAAA